MTEIKGPLGIWTFPVLNALVAMRQDSSEAEITKVNRDSEGNIESIEKVKRQ